MQRVKVPLAIILFLAGMAGVLSLLTMEFNIPQETRELLESQFTPQQIKWLSLINPTILLIITVIIGTILHDKVNLDVPLIKRFLSIEKKGNAKKIFVSGIIGGIIAGAAITLFGIIYSPLMPDEFLKLGRNIQPSLATRFLYGGITEEILLRFGLMTLFTWLLYKIFKRLNEKIYWTAIILAALIFAIGHFPAVYQAVNTPSATLLSYVILGNSVGGIIFGWLYWKRGLESAFTAHIFAHVIMVSLGFMVSIS